MVRPAMQAAKSATSGTDHVYYRLTNKVRSSESMDRVESRLSSLALAHLFSATLAVPYSRGIAMTPSPPSSNRACDFPAHGFPMCFTARHAQPPLLGLAVERPL